MSPNASHRVRPGLSSAASLITTLLISFDQEVLNQHLNLDLNLVTPEYPSFESPCPLTRIGVRPLGPLRGGRSSSSRQATQTTASPVLVRMLEGASRRPRGAHGAGGPEGWWG